jgi:uncharacterized membrane protein
MKRAMQILNGESGQVLVTGVMCIGLLMGFMAVAIDVGLLYRAKRIMQIAADAGSVKLIATMMPSPNCFMIFSST